MGAPCTFLAPSIKESKTYAYIYIYTYGYTDLSNSGLKGTFDCWTGSSCLMNFYAASVGQTCVAYHELDIVESHATTGWGMLHVLAGWSGTCNLDVWKVRTSDLVVVFMDVGKSPPNCVGSPKATKKPTTRALKNAHFSRLIQWNISYWIGIPRQHTWDLWRLDFLKGFLDVAKRGNFNKLTGN